MKKFLFIYGVMDEGGAQHVLIDILNHFDYKQNEVTLIQITGGGVRRNEVNENVRVITAWNNYCFSYSIAYHCSNNLHFDYPLKHRFLNAIKRNHFDVAVSFLEGMPLKVHAMITEIADRNYSWVHCDLYKDRYEEVQFREGEEIVAYNKMDGVVCVATYTARAFKRRFRDCTSEVKVIYNPIDIDKIVNLSCSLSPKHEEFGSVIPDSKFKIVVCGRLTAPKKLDRVMRLARRIKDEELPINIQLIGDGNLRDFLEQETLKLHISDVVEFLGFARNPYPYIKSADMLLSTSGFEGFSLVICEAMALGVPVVATKTAGPMEILDENRFGLLCEHDDESIYQAVTRMYEDSELRRHYAEVGKERVKDFSVEKTMMEIYRL